MNPSHSPSSVCVFLLFLCVGGIVALDANETLQLHKSTHSSPSSIHTSYVFSDYPLLDLPSGEIIEVLLGFTNTGDKTVMITHIGASLNHPQDFKYYIQNYTKFEYDLLVHPEDQVSLSYRFRPDSLLEPRPFGLILSVYYHDEVGGNFTTVFFNGTIHIVDPDTGFDFQQAFIYIGLIAVLGLGGFFAYEKISKNTKLGRPKKTSSLPYVEVASIKKGAPIVNVDNEWLQGTHAVSPTRARPKKEQKKQK